MFFSGNFYREIRDNISAMYVFRPALLEELPMIHRMQDIPFRHVVYANNLPKLEDFVENETHAIQTGQEQYYLFEVDGRPDGFVQYLKREKDWSIIVWGKWLNTLIYLGLKTAYDDLGCPNVTSAVRDTNKRVTKAYEKFRIRRTGSEMTLYRPGGIFGYIATANLIYYEMTREEFEERREFLRSQSLDVKIMPPPPLPAVATAAE